ncbi:MAG: hypothetical protein LBS92_03530 [Candidatus Methanoplasma sp.]|jgi:hypothetical protein|nr:hypothetical protein [Candidatus Methanoplasma sp.]
MKRKTIAIAIYLAAILMFVAFLASAFTPLAGGVSIGNTDEYSISTEGKKVKVEWGTTIESSLPYRINDAGMSVKIGGEHSVVIAETASDIGKGSTQFDLNGEVSSITALMLATSGESGSGVYLPMEFRIHGSYPFSLFKLDIEIKALVSLSDTGTIDADWRSDRVTVTASGIGGTVMGAIDSFSGTVRDSDVTVSITKTSGSVVFEIASPSGDLAWSLEGARDADGGLTIDIVGGGITLGESEVGGIIDAVRRGSNP